VAVEEARVDSVQEIANAEQSLAEGSSEQVAKTPNVNMMLDFERKVIDCIVATKVVDVINGLPRELAMESLKKEVIQARQDNPEGSISCFVTDAELEAEFVSILTAVTAGSEETLKHIQAMHSNEARGFLSRQIEARKLQNLNESTGTSEFSNSTSYLPKATLADQINAIKTIADYTALVNEITGKLKKESLTILYKFLVPAEIRIMGNDRCTEIITRISSKEIQELHPNFTSMLNVIDEDILEEIIAMEDEDSYAKIMDVHNVLTSKEIAQA
jgi:hypothetical protein